MITAANTIACEIEPIVEEFLFHNVDSMLIAAFGHSGDVGEAGREEERGQD